MLETLSKLEPLAEGTEALFKEGLVHFQTLSGSRTLAREAVAEIAASRSANHHWLLALAFSEPERGPRSVDTRQACFVAAVKGCVTAGSGNSLHLVARAICEFVAVEQNPAADALACVVEYLEACTRYEGDHRDLVRLNAILTLQVLMAECWLKPTVVAPLARSMRFGWGGRADSLSGDLRGLLDELCAESLE